MNLEESLNLLAGDVQFAPTPDFASTIGGRLVPRVHRVDWRRRILVAAAMILLMLVAAVAYPDTRTAIAKWLDLGGIRIEFIDELLDRDDGVEIDSALIVGEEIDPSDARLPSGTSLRGLAGIEPEQVYQRTDGDSTTISFVYAPSDTLPEIGETGVGALLMEIDSPQDLVIMVKRIAPPEDGEFTEVGNLDAFWVDSGELEAVPYDPQGSFGLETVSRQTGNVLLWQSNGVTYRLETNLDRRAAIALAESLSPLSS